MAAVRCLRAAISRDWDPCNTSILVALAATSINSVDDSAAGSGVSLTDVKREAVWWKELAAARIIDDLLIISREGETSQGSEMWKKLG